MLDFMKEVEAVGRIPALPAILDIVCRTTGMATAILARVTEERWVACHINDTMGLGLVPGSEMDVKTTICYQQLKEPRPLIVPNVSEHPVLKDHPSPKTVGFQSFVLVPVVLPSGSFFGTLSALHPEPRDIDRAEMVPSVELLAELIAFHLEAELELARSAETLATERQVSELREQFIAVLGHDLRNPLASVAAGAQMLERRPDRAADILGQMDTSIVRMSRLINDVMDFARGRLGGGLTMAISPNPDLAQTLTQVVQELRNAKPDRAIEMELRVDRPISCDDTRIAQLVSNLLGNALTHGSSERPVRVEAHVEEDEFVFSISNGGEPIPPQAMDKLFQPFVRTAASAGRDGLGLGLFIASEIARGHGGKLLVASNDEETRFTFRMPTQGPKQEGPVLIYSAA
jgi:signal transduction histidine kinase